MIRRCYDIITMPIPASDATGRLRPFPFFYDLTAAISIAIPTAILLAVMLSPVTHAQESATQRPPEPKPAETNVDVTKRIDPTDFKHRFDLRSEYVDYGAASMMAVVPRVEYAFSNSLAVRAEIPVLRYDTGSTAGAADGIGNLQTRLAWRAVRGDGYAMVVGSELSLNTASDARLGSGKNVVAPFAFWAIDLPAMKSVFFPYLQLAKSVGGDSAREDVRFTNFRTSLLTRWPARTYSFVEVSYWFDHEHGNRYSSAIKAELGKFVSPKTGFYLRPGTGMSGTDERLGMKWSMEVGMRHFF
jgi:hypothetical protein